MLSYDNGQGVKFLRTIAVDAHSMFTITDQVTNGAAQTASLRAYGLVEQQGLSADVAKSSIVHEGAIGILGATSDTDKYTLKLAKYKDWKKKGYADLPSKGGWLGVTEKYWLTALIPDQDEQITAKFPVKSENGVDIYESGYLAAAQTIAPGQTLTHTTRVFAGAKTVPLLRAYGAQPWASPSSTRRSTGASSGSSPSRSSAYWNSSTAISATSAFRSLP